MILKAVQYFNNHVLLVVGTKLNFIETMVNCIVHITYKYKYITFRD